MMQNEDNDVSKIKTAPGHYYLWYVQIPREKKTLSTAAIIN